MEVYLQSLGFDIQQLVKNGYNTRKTSLVETIDKILYEYNEKARNAILCGLEDVEFTKVMQCTSAKEIWDKLKSIYERVGNVKKAKLHTFSMQFETMQMKEEETIAAYFLGVDEIVNSIKGHGATI